MIIVLDLPLPPQKLHPNERVGWVQKAQLIKKNRVDVAMVGRLQAPEKPFKTAKVRGTFYVNKRNDEDNLNSWIKSSLDALQDAGIIENDKGIELLPPYQVVDSRGPRKLLLSIEGEP